MSAVHDTTKERKRDDRDGCSRPWSRHCPLLDEPLPLIGYVTGVLACYLAFVGWEAMSTPVTDGDITLFAALMCCGAICVEASGRLGQPTGAWRDLLSAWWLPVALLLPPLYALAAPALLGLLSHVRVRRGAAGRRIFASAALGLSGALASALFRLLIPVAPQGQAEAWLAYPGPNAWLMRPREALAAIGCAVVFGVLNAGLVAAAAWLADPDARLANLLRDRERMLLDLTETCV
ncbi:MAG: GGDEF domain-containing protein, partial [Trebonia sp.]